MRFELGRFETFDFSQIEEFITFDKSHRSFYYKRQWHCAEISTAIISKAESMPNGSFSNLRLVTNDTTNRLKGSRLRTHRPSSTYLGRLTTLIAGGQLMP